MTSQSTAPSRTWSITLPTLFPYLLYLVAGLALLPALSLSHLTSAAMGSLREHIQEPLSHTSSLPRPIHDGKFAHNNTLPPEEKKVFALFDNTGKTAIVTGAGAGIGLAVAQALAESGANVAIWYHGNGVALQRAKEIEKEYKVKCRAYQVDVQSAQGVQDAVDAVVHDFNGRLDIMVANAGIPWTQGNFLDGDINHYKSVMAIDMDGVYYCARAAGLHWRRQKIEGTTITGETLQGFSYGSFIATSSMSGHIVNIPQLQAAYNAAKAAVLHFVRSIAVDMVGFARANTISPGYILTDISNFIPGETKQVWNDKIPMGRPGTVAELKGAFLYLASDVSSYTTGADILVDGGYSLP